MPAGEVSPRYTEGAYGETPGESQEPIALLSPIAELEATVEFEDATIKARLLLPILSTDANRLLAR